MNIDVDKAAQALRDTLHSDPSRKEPWSDLSEETRNAYRRRVRPVVTAILSGIEASPTVDRDALAYTIWDSTNDDPDLLWENVHVREYHDLADAIITNLNLTDAAAIRANERRRVAEEIAAAIEDGFAAWDSLSEKHAPHPMHSPEWLVERSYAHAARIARDATLDGTDTREA